MIFREIANVDTSSAEGPQNRGLLPRIIREIWEGSQLITSSVKNSAERGLALENFREIERWAGDDLELITQTKSIRENSVEWRLDAILRNCIWNSLFHPQGVGEMKSQEMNSDFIRNDSGKCIHERRFPRLKLRGELASAKWAVYRLNGHFPGWVSFQRNLSG